MDIYSQLEQNFRSEKRIYEEEEDQLILDEKNAMNQLDDVLELSLHAVRKYFNEPNMDAFQQGVSRVAYLREEIHDSVQNERKNLIKKTDHLEEEYMRNRKEVEGNL